MYMVKLGEKNKNKIQGIYGSNYFPRNFIYLKEANIAKQRVIDLGGEANVVKIDKRELK
jgi:hypothetical protein